ncbi:MAG: L,D-transpeptidase family protein [Dactylosporangium sp.]|nr:L,D-transpeptidase family protein [Dactylosporangium sp.]NNJ61343.1 L,D-transpeptidase family protein [Dactylosporangium sp.]
MVVGALALGGGVAYALAPSAADQAAAMEAPDGTQPASPVEAPASASVQVTQSASPVAPSAQPSPSGPSPSAQPSVAASGANCPTGENQREVEGYLAQIGGYGAVTVDGQQSPADCAAIRKFQTRFGISPPKGRAGPTTVSVARRIALSLTSAELAKCGAGPALTACVDLTLQTMWVVRNGDVVFGPTVIRTGMKGYATPTGTYSVFRRNVKEWSNPYEVWLPYWQNFVRGIGFHATTTYLHRASIGSHGCVNLLYNDAKTLYGTIGMRTPVKVFGHRSGT